MSTNLRGLLVAVTLLALMAGTVLLVYGPESSATVESAAPLGRSPHASASASSQAPRGPFEVERATTVDFMNVASTPKGPAAPVGKPRRHPRMPISEAKAAQLRREARNQLPNPMVTRLDKGPRLDLGPTAAYFSKITNFDTQDAASNTGTLVPPDPEMAAGPNHLVTLTNIRIEIWNKAGVNLGGADTDAFFGVAGGGCGSTFDPNVLYDEENDRWVIGIDGNGTHYCVAFSTTNDPTGSYNVYAVPTATGNQFFDYPHAGLSDDLLVMGANMFGTFSFLESRVWAVDKNDGYAGLSLTGVTKSLGSVPDTPQPMHAHGIAAGTYPVGTDHYILTEDFSGPTFDVWKWADPLSGSSPTKLTTLNWPGGGGFPISSPTAGGQTLSGNDWRPQDAEYYNGSIWTIRHVSCNPGSGTRMCIGWAEIDLFGAALPTVRQGGVVAHPNAYLIFPDIAPNACGDALIGFTATGPNLRPTQVVAVRKGSAPLNTINGSAIVKQGTTNYNAFDGSPHRWGDYTGATPDPNGSDFWYMGEISDPSNVDAKWGTHVIGVQTLCES